MASFERFYNPKVLARIGRLELRAKMVVEGIISGMHKSPYHGFSVEFAEYRQYLPGDDLSRIDWKVYARNDRYFVKKFEEETNVDCHLLLDISASMGYGSREVTKLQYGSMLAASLAYLMNRQRDAVGLTTFDEADPLDCYRRRTSVVPQQALALSNSKLAVTMADNHVIYKNGAKEIAFLHGCSISFMSKPFEDWIGNSCHIHSSLSKDGQAAFASDDTLFDRWLAGQIACAKELAVFFAPTINSYKRYAAGSWAPTTLAWGHDNRTCGFRVVGHGQGLRVETRIPGGDVNPYLAFAAIIASGLHGIEHELRLPAALEGNAYESRADRFPSTMRDAIEALEQGSVARAAFGDQVVDHYLNYARTEQGLFDRHVTDWERKRYFERT